MYKICLIIFFVVLGPILEHIAFVFDLKKPSDLFYWLSKKAASLFTKIGKIIAFISYYIYIGAWKFIKHIWNFIEKYFNWIIEFFKKWFIKIIKFLKLDQFIINSWNFWKYILETLFSPVYVIIGYFTYIYETVKEYLEWYVTWYIFGTITLFILIFYIIKYRKKIFMLFKNTKTKFKRI